VLPLAKFFDAANIFACVANRDTLSWPRDALGSDPHLRLRRSFPQKVTFALDRVAFETWELRADQLFRESQVSKARPGPPSQLRSQRFIVQGSHQIA
jgi:hypothetical protein